MSFRKLLVGTAVATCLAGAVAPAATQAQVTDDARVPNSATQDRDDDGFDLGWLGLLGLAGLAGLMRREDRDVEGPCAAG